MMSASARRNAGTPEPWCPRQKAALPSCGRMHRTRPAAATGQAAAASACACARLRAMLSGFWYLAALDCSRALRTRHAAATEHPGRGLACGLWALACRVHRADLGFTP